jgi:hypothetical protein
MQDWNNFNMLVGDLNFVIISLGAEHAKSGDGPLVRK